MKTKDFDGAERRLKEGLAKVRSQKNATFEGLYLSAMGVLFKLKRDFKESYKYYQQAERLLPDDNSVRIISATLLIQEFKQHDTAIRKLKKVIESAPGDIAIAHHALALLGVAYLSMGKKPLAKQVLEEVLKQDFTKLSSSAYVNYKFPEICVAKNFEPELCLEYLRKAAVLADLRREGGYKHVITQLIDQIENLKKQKI
jgi:tetratricopeptide (TPR) repeat protein